MAAISGRKYVVARQRLDNKAKVQLRIVHERNCDHEHTICTGRLTPDGSIATTIDRSETCAESWQVDWELLFDRTQGGRKLKEDITP